MIANTSITHNLLNIPFTQDCEFTELAERCKQFAQTLELLMGRVLIDELLGRIAAKKNPAARRA